MTIHHRRALSAVAAAALLSACGSQSGGPAATSSASTTASAWTVTEAAVRPAGRVAALIPTATCALAVGSVSTGYGRVAASWRSTDCRTFTSDTPTAPAQEGDALPRESKISMTGVATIRDGTLIAVGYEEERDDAFPQHARAWRSSDGLRWQLLPEAFPPSADGVLHDTPQGVIRLTNGTLLAYGSAAGFATVWHSTDGSRWSASRVAPSAGIDDVAQTGTGRLVAVGQRSHSDTYEGRDAAEWTSDDDGRTWRPGDADDGSFTRPNEQILSDVAPLPDGGWIAIGFLRTAPDKGTVAVWRSPDGGAWHLQQHAIPAVGPFSAAAGLAVAGQRLVIGGRDGDANTGRAAIWTSMDGGRTWNAEPLNAPPVEAIIAVAGGLVVAIAGDTTATRAPPPA